MFNSNGKALPEINLLRVNLQWNIASNNVTYIALISNCIYVAMNIHNLKLIVSRTGWYQKCKDSTVLISNIMALLNITVS